jgi:hypothetical protein
MARRERGARLPARRQSVTANTFQRRGRRFVGSGMAARTWQTLTDRRPSSSTHRLPQFARVRGALCHRR